MTEDEFKALKVGDEVYTVDRTDRDRSHPRRPGGRAPMTHTDLKTRVVEAATARLPAPIPGGQPVTPSLAEWIRRECPDAPVAEAIIAGIEARSAFGLEKYGQTLSAGDGRPNYAETLQELLDALQYAHRAEMDGDRSLDDPVMCWLVTLLMTKLVHAKRGRSIDDALARIIDAAARTADGNIHTVNYGNITIVRPADE